ncbi:MAG: carbonic anhydrase family protein [Proteobacteria bacterium]|nr:carbonic anhydrase family protein [Pseudomonadota bacterium]
MINVSRNVGGIFFYRLTYLANRKLCFLTLSALVLSVSFAGCKPRTKNSQNSIKDANIMKHRMRSPLSEEYYSHQANWGGACPSQLRQSPIKLDVSNTGSGGEKPIEFTYKSAEVTLVDAGHTLRGDIKGFGGAVTYDGKTYELKQFHFHTPSEHVFSDREASDMELHLVHKRKPDDAKDADIAFVFGFLIRKDTTGSKFFNSVFDRFSSSPLLADEKDSKHGLTLGSESRPKFRSELDEGGLSLEGEVHHEKPLDGGPITLDFSQLVPAKAKFYVYKGSLTTESCDEVVTHAVGLNELAISPTQIESFSDYYGISKRELQKPGSPNVRKYQLANSVKVSR